MSDKAPHSVVYWLKWEVHERKFDGQLSGCPKDNKDYRGVLHCENREEAKKIMEGVISRFTEDVKSCHEQLKIEKEVSND